MVKLQELVVSSLAIVEKCDADVERRLSLVSLRDQEVSSSGLTIEKIAASPNFQLQFFSQC